MTAGKAGVHLSSAELARLDDDQAADLWRQASSRYRILYRQCFSACLDEMFGVVGDKEVDGKAQYL